MFRKIVAAFLCILIFMGVLAAGGLTISEFARRIEFKNPIDVFNPLLRKLGINFDISIPSDSGGSLLVDAEDKVDDSSDSETPGQTDKPTLPSLPDIPKPSNPGNDKPDEPTNPTNKVTKAQLNDLIATIRVVNKDELRTGYDRSSIESPVKSYELDGKKYNRNKYAWKTSEYLISEDPFKYECPYTGLIIEDESKLDYEHIIPLSVVYSTTDWDNKKLNEYAYDQDVGVDVYYSANRSKGSKTPADWLPNVNIENYCYTWLVIASEWDIPLEQRDIDICRLYCLNAINSGQTLERIN